MPITRRHAILTTSAAALAATARPAFAAGPAWQAYNGMSSAQYQTTFDQLAAQGYRLTQVSGYEVAGQTQFAAIWVQTAGPPLIAHHDMNAAQYQQTFDQLGGQGYRLVRVSGYEVGGQDYYAAFWVQGSGAPYQANHAMTPAQYQQTFNQLTAQGYVLTWVSAYAVAGQPLFAAIFTQQPGPAWQAHGGLSTPDFQHLFDQLTGQGYRLDQVSVASINNAPWFTGIFTQRAGPAWQARSNLTGPDYQQTFNNMGQQGLRLTDVSGYAVSGQALYAGIWVSG